MVNNYNEKEENFIISESKEKMITISLEIIKDALLANKDMSIIFRDQDILFLKKTYLI
jgi:hypothetical protein